MSSGGASCRTPFEILARSNLYKPPPPRSEPRRAQNKYLKILFVIVYNACVAYVCEN